MGACSSFASHAAADAEGAGKSPTGECSSSASHAASDGPRNVEVVVNGSAGPCCTVEASTAWTILQVHKAIWEKIHVPMDWQTLLRGTQPLAEEVTVGSLTSNNVESLELTLIVEEVPEPEYLALYQAIQCRNEDGALQLLKRRQLACLNEKNLHGYGQTFLHEAMGRSLQKVAEVIAAKPEFLLINAKDVFGQTCLHCAAQIGYVSVCQIILARPEFEELLAVNEDGRTALQEARRKRHRDVVDFLEKAEAELLGAQR